MSATTFHALLAEIRAGSGQALGALVELYQPRLLELAKEQIPPELAGKVSPSDAVQDASMEAIRNIASLRATSEQQCRAWLESLLVNTVRDAVRRFAVSQKREVRRERPIQSEGSQNLMGVLATVTNGPLDQVLCREKLERLDRALSKLTPEHREVLELHSRDGKTFRAIGRLQDKSPDAVRMMWNRAVTELTKELRDVI